MVHNKNKKRKSFKRQKTKRPRSKKKRGPRARAARSMGTLNNSLIAAPYKNTLGFSRSKRLKQITISHREYLFDVFSENLAVQIESIELNPGLHTIFPWLSVIAPAFETYKWQDLNFSFVPTKSTSTDGSFAFCPDYDPDDDSAAALKAELLSYEDTTRGPVWNPLNCRCTAANLHNRKTHYVRTGALSSSLNTKDYDAAKMNFVIDSSAIAADDMIGEVWADYTITLTIPQLEPFAEGYIKIESTSSGAQDRVFDADVAYSSSLGAAGGVFNIDTTASPSTISMYKPGVYEIASESRSSNTVWNPTLDRFDIDVPTVVNGALKSFHGGSATFLKTTIGFDDNTANPSAVNTDSTYLWEVPTSATKENPSVLTIHAPYETPSTMVASTFKYLITTVPRALYNLYSTAPKPLSKNLRRKTIYDGILVPRSLKWKENEKTKKPKITKETKEPVITKEQIQTFMKVNGTKNLVDLIMDEKKQI